VRQAEQAAMFFWLHEHAAMLKLNKEFFMTLHR